MANGGGPNDGNELVRRAEKLAVGVADTGLTQAEEMLRRVSPEGRAQARRAREALARRRNGLLARVAVAAIVSLLAYALLSQVTAPAISMIVAAALMLAMTFLVIARTRPRLPSRETLVGADLAALPAEAAMWLAGQRRSLPAPAVQLTDVLSRRLDDLAPQLARLDPREPAAETVRKLISTELPGLVEGWRGVPVSLRGMPQVDGRTPNAQLADGLAVIDAEVARMTEQLARGALDEVATQGRYLELKYRNGDGLNG